jgi:hypothetical protein
MSGKTNNNLQEIFSILSNIQSLLRVKKENKKNIDIDLDICKTLDVD